MVSCTTVAYWMKVNVPILLSEGQQILQSHVWSLFHSFKILFTAQSTQNETKNKYYTFWS